MRRTLMLSLLTTSVLPLSVASPAQGQTPPVLSCSAVTEGQASTCHATVTGGSLSWQSGSQSGTVAVTDSILNFQVPTVDDNVVTGPQTIPVTATYYGLTGNATIAVAENDQKCWDNSIIPITSQCPVQPPPVVWKKCADENQTCKIVGTANVRYIEPISGKNSVHVVTNSISCSNGAFGGDPYYGRVKICETDGVVAPVVVKPVITIAAATADEGLGSMTFSLLRSGDLSLTSKVTVTEIPGTALAGVDYVPSTSTVVFSPGSTSGTAAVGLINDSIPEPTKTFTVKATEVLNANVSGATAIGTLTDTDVVVPTPPPTPPTFGVPDVSVSERAGSVVVHVTKSGANGSPSVITYDAAPGHGMASPGLDFTPVTGTINVPDSQVDIPITIPILDDALVEGDETFNLTVTATSNGQVARSGIITIIDDEQAPAPSPQPPSGSWVIVPMSPTPIHVRVTKTCTAYSGEAMVIGDIYTVLPGAGGWSVERNGAFLNGTNFMTGYTIVGVPYGVSTGAAIYLYTDCLEGLAP